MSENIKPDFSKFFADSYSQKEIIELTENEFKHDMHTPDILPHSDILNELITQFEPLDFEVLAYPQIEKLREKLLQIDTDSTEAKEVRKQLEKLTISTRQYRILAIENVIRIAEKNNWGLCKKHEFIYLFNGNFWSEIDKELFQKFLGEASEKMGVLWENSKDYVFREHLLKQFLATQYLTSPKIDISTVLINLKNGTFEITANGTKLRLFERSDFITYQLPFEYNPLAKAPLFEAYLNKVLPDKACQNVLAEYLGYVFIKHGSNRLKEEKALILYGTGANGKSVFFEIVTALFGRENVSNYSLQSLTEEKGYYRAKIATKLLNYAVEISGKLEASLFKNMVSGEAVEACLKYGQPFTMTDYAKFIFNCNELPKDVEHTNAYFRRFLIIPFEVTIPENEQDKTLHSKIIESELSGVFNWVLKGLDRLLNQQKFSQCDAAKKALDKYRMESDSVQMFLNEYEYKISTQKETALKDMYNEYRTYCYDSGLKICSQKTVADRLRNAGYTTERKNFGTVVNCEKK